MSTPNTRITVTTAGQQQPVAPSEGCTAGDILDERGDCLIACDGPCSGAHEPEAICAWCHMCRSHMCRSHMIDEQVVREGCCTCVLEFRGKSPLGAGARR